jgi:membrane protein
VVTVIYHAGPNTELPWRSSLPGAIAFTVTWLAATLGLGYYVANFGSYDVTYGALAGAVLILLWLYVTALVLLVGAEINDVLVEMRDPGAPAAHSPGGAARSRPTPESEEQPGS